MRTDRRMVWVSLTAMFCCLSVMAVASWAGHAWWGIGFALVIAVVANAIVRCPRCGANAYRQETALLGATYSILNSSCYRCGLSFTRECDAANDPERSQWTVDSPSWRRDPAPSRPRSVGLWARLLLVMTAGGIGYVNLRAVLDPEMSWGEVMLRATALAGAYTFLVALVLKVVRLFGGNARNTRDSSV